MAPKGQRYRLVLYTYILNRLWRKTLGIGVILLALAAALAWLPSVLPTVAPAPLADSSLLILGGTGAFAVCVSIFLAVLRKSAYVQPFNTHLRLVTPFLRLNISYKRFIRTSIDEMGRLFSVEELKGYKQDFLRPLTRETAVVLELKGWPLPRKILNLYLSPFFFPDQFSRLALMVPDWIKFSTEMESFRGAWRDSLLHQDGTPQSDLLASLAVKR
jgi:hypothetical protein